MTSCSPPLPFFQSPTAKETPSPPSLLPTHDTSLFEPATLPPLPHLFTSQVGTCQMLSNYLICLMIPNYLICLMISNYLICLMISNYLICLMISNYLICLMISNYLICLMISNYLICLMISNYLICLMISNYLICLMISNYLICLMIRGVSDVDFKYSRMWISNIRGCGFCILISADIGCGYYIFYYTRVMKMSFGHR